MEVCSLSLPKVGYFKLKLFVASLSPLDFVLARHGKSEKINIDALRKSSKERTPDLIPPLHYAAARGNSGFSVTVGVST